MKVKKKNFFFQRLALREVLVQQLDRHRQTSFFASQQQIRKRAFQLREQRSAQLKGAN